MTKILVGENKKQQIMDYIQSINSTNPLAYSKISVTERMADESYSSTKVGNLIDELCQDDLVDIKKIKTDIVFPTSKRKEIMKNWNKHLALYDDMLVVGTIYIVLIVATYFFKNDYMDAAILYPLILYVGFKCSQWTFNISQRYIPLIKNLNTKLLFLNIASVISFLLVGYFSSQLLSQQYTVAILLTSITLGIAVGSIVYKVYLNKD